MVGRLKQFPMLKLLMLGASLVTLGVASPFATSPTSTAGRVISYKAVGLVVHAPTEATWPHVPFGTLRLWDTRTAWLNLEPVEGKWNFDGLDAVVALAQRHKTDVILTLGSTPQWASARPKERCPYGYGCAAEPRTLDLWKAYVRTVVTRYRGRIRYYEIWNEPNLSARTNDLVFFSGNTEALLALARATKEIVNSIDPSARILSPAPIAEPRRIESFLAAGGGGTFDIFAAHFYENDPEHIPARIAEMRALLKKYGLGKKPIWNTEAGFIVNKWPGRSEKTDKYIIKKDIAAAVSARYLVFNMFFGIERMVLYAWDDKVMSLSANGTGEPNAVGAAYGRVAGWLGGSTLGQCKQKAPTIWGCSLSRNGTAAMILWSTVDGQKFTKLTIGGNTRAETLSGKIVTLPPDGILLGAKPVLVSDRIEAFAS